MNHNAELPPTAMTGMPIAANEDGRSKARRCMNIRQARCQLGWLRLVEHDGELCAE